MRTFSAKPADIKQDWYIVDAEGVVLGRLASQVAQILRGKHKPIFTPHIDTGDFVIVINAEKVRLTGTKEEKKSYFHHTGYPGGVRVRSYNEMMAKYPERVIEKAVKGMIPHNRLGRQILKKLKVYAGADHPHAAQQPKPLEIR
ncbi:MAG: 50S ribosomal protein L13 [bacterium]|nr:50S ribosomal protein L13 [Candidatus Neomarinimicrobiota bacterium]MDD4960972.1 50S ribosomal protein L13 [Candidatus Neomarinimicrobiota bacterium]MDD5710110.1 50S ribosomal protein L13 [Candidatus Neomarinimicrobiota bacterium]MDX9781293.1 50S ribosomal protein L13 [bacterium]